MSQSAKLSDPVQLTTPVEIDGKKVKTVRLRKPTVGDLRGLKASDVMQSDVNTMITLLPRITQPPMTPDQIAALEVADFMQMCGQVVVFSVGPEAAAALQAQA